MHFRTGAVHAFSYGPRHSAGREMHESLKPVTTCNSMMKELQKPFGPYISGPS